MAQRQREVDIEDDDLDDKIVDKKDDVLVDPEDGVDEDGPDNAEARRQAEAEARRGRSKRRASDEDDEDDGDTRLAYDDIDDEDGGQRQSRRQKRNRARREAKSQAAELIAAQDKRIKDLEDAIRAQGLNHLGLAAQDVDGQLNEERRNLADIDRAIARAVTESNGELHARALRLRDEANARLNALAYKRSQLEHVAQQQLQQPAQRREEAKIEIDPRAEAYSDRFMERHPWFDPLDGEDDDSQMVKAIDDTLVNQGYNPNTKRYWLELERRVAARGLGSGSEGDDVDDDYRDDERPSRRQKNSGGLPPRSRRGGAGDRDSRPREDDRTLPALARDTLDQLGLLEKKGLTAEQLKEREKYITTWRKGLKEAREAQSQR